MIDSNLKAEHRIYSNLPEDLKKIMKENLLSEEEHAVVLEDIKEASYAGKRTSETPKFVIVLGQTGSGKTNLTGYLKNTNSNLVVIDSDKYKAYRKDARDLQIKYPERFGHITAPDAYWHRDEMICDAMSKKYDILMECAPTQKEGMFVNLNEIKKAGYNIELNVLAVGQLNSLLSIHERYEAQLTLKYPAAKLTDISRHDDSYTSLQKSISDAQKGDIKISIFGRGVERPEEPRLLYKTGEYSDKFTSPLEALISAQTEDNLRTIRGFDKRYFAIQTQMYSRTAPELQIKQLDSVRERYIKLRDSDKNFER